MLLELQVGEQLDEKTEQAPEQERDQEQGAAGQVQVQMADRWTSRQPSRLCQP